MSNPALDPRVAITGEELKAILESRKKRGLDQTYWAGSEMTEFGLLWYVSEFMHQYGANRGKCPEVAQSWHRRASTLAGQVMANIANDLIADSAPTTISTALAKERIQNVEDALNGEASPSLAEPDSTQKVLSAVNDWCKSNPEKGFPSQVVLLGFDPSLKKGTVQDVYSKVPMLKQVKPALRGRKPK